MYFEQTCVDYLIVRPFHFGLELSDCLGSHCKATHLQQVVRLSGFLIHLVLRGISRDDV